eukprot:5414670-Pleurochrysis_carterae.AAC.1
MRLPQRKTFFFRCDFTRRKQCAQISGRSTESLRTDRFVETEHASLTLRGAAVSRLASLIGCETLPTFPVAEG